MSSSIINILGMQLYTEQPYYEMHIRYMIQKLFNHGCKCYNSHSHFEVVNVQS